MRGFYTIAIGFALLSAGSAAAEQALSNFNRSVQDLYSMSRMCEQTLAPGPAYYIDVIDEYLRVYYEQGARGHFWVLPEVSRRMNNPRYCALWLDRYVLQYRSATEDFMAAYPDEIYPPYLPKLDEFAVAQTVIRPARPAAKARKPVAPEWGTGQ